MDRCEGDPRPDDGFFGRTVRSRTCGEFRIVEKRHAASDRTPEHEHSKPYATFVIDGEYVETVGGCTSVVPRGSVLLHPAGECHADRFADRETTLINVELPAWSDRRSGIDRNEAAADPEMRMIASRVRRELYHGDDFSDLVIEGMMLELVAFMMRKGSTRPAGGTSIARRADRLIAARFSERLGLSDIAAELGVDPAHLARSFRREIGCTVGERMRRVRVERACAIMDQGASLAEVALATGFSDQSHFTRTFRAVAGVTPGEYRRRN